jgi:hypothetical protein
VIDLVGTSTTRWNVAAMLHGDGSLATPFE